MTLKDTLVPPRSPRHDDSNGSSAIEGQDLPSDYLDFVRTYGRGVIADFLRVLLPHSANRFLDLSTQLTRQSRALTDLRERFGLALPHRPYPEPNGLIPWAISDNGDVCFWRTSDESPDTWTVVVADGRMSDWYEYPGGMSQFLEAVLSRSVVCGVFPDDWPPAQPTFSVE